MRVQIGKWGNSLAIRLPAALAQQAALKEGDMVEADINPDGSVRIVHGNAFDKQAFLARLDQLHQKLPRTISVMAALKDEARY